MKGCGVTVVLGVLIIGVLCWFVCVDTTRRQAIMIRLFRGDNNESKPSIWCAEENPELDLTVDRLENEHPQADGVLSASLFIRDRAVFEERYLKPLLDANDALRGTKSRWYYRVYVPIDFDAGILQTLLSHDIEVAVMASRNKGFEATLWRFLPLFDTKPFLCCDADTDIYKKLWDDVEEWVQSNNTFFHRVIPVINRFWPMSAASWGCKPTQLTDLEKADLYTHLLHFGQKCTCFGCDELFLAQHIYPKFASHSVIRRRILPILEPLIIVGIVLAIVLSVFLFQVLNRCNKNKR